MAEGVRAGYDALITLGGASPGDKTMLDALLPFVEAGVAAGEPWLTSWDRATTIAQQGRREGSRPAT